MHRLYSHDELILQFSDRFQICGRTIKEICIRSCALRRIGTDKHYPQFRIHILNEHGEKPVSISDQKYIEFCKRRGIEMLSYRRKRIYLPEGFVRQIPDAMRSGEAAAISDHGRCA